MTGMIDFVEADKTGEPFQKESKVRKRQEDACMCCSGGGMAQQTNRRYCTKMTDIINRARARIWRQGKSRFQIQTDCRWRRWV